MRLVLTFLFVYFFVSAIALAADVEVVDNVTLEADGLNYTIKAPGRLDSFKVNPSSFEFTLSELHWVEITSADRRSFSLSTNISHTFSCTANLSTLKIERHTGDPQVTVTVTPSSSSCAIGGGGVLGGGGGGIITQASPILPQPTVVPPAPAAVAGVIFLVDLSLGMQNEDVKKLQEFLRQDLQLYPEGLVTGYFGPLTQAAVKRFQAKYGLPQVGRVGPLTRSKLNEIFGKEKPSAQPQPSVTPQEPATSPFGITRLLRRGAFHEEVRILQTLLARDKEIYPEGEITGYFGPLTKKAVERFQQKFGIVSSGDEETTGFGLVGPRTRLKLQEVFAR